MRARKKFFMVLVVILIFLSIVSPSLAEQYRSIKDLREEVQNGWHQTYEAHGRTILVDVDIDVPETDAFPIVEITFPGIMPIFDARAVVDDLNERALNITVEEAEGFFQSTKSGQATMYLEPDALPENNPFTPDDAMDFLQQFTNQYNSVLGDQKYEVAVFAAQSKYYKVVDQDMYKTVLDYDKPLSQVGAYLVSMRQLFHDIPYLAYYAPRGAPKKDDGLPYPPFGKLVGYIANDNNYSLLFEPAKEVGVVVDDVPMVTFQKCKAVMEGLIEDGLLRTLYSVSLGYMAHQNPNNLGKSFLLLPVWYVRCELVDKANAPDIPMLEGAAGEFSRKYNGSQVIISAQTGEYKSPYDTDMTRDYADHIITWNEVK